MKQMKLVLAFFFFALCLNIVNAQKEEEMQFDMFQKLISSSIKQATQDPNFQLNFLQGFIKGFIYGEIKLYDLAINHSNKIGSEKANKIKSEVDGLIAILFQGRFSTLQEIVEDIKQNEPEALRDIFSKSSFNEDLKHFNYQQQLAEAISSRLVDQKASNKEKLTQSIKNLDLLKKFFIQYRGIKEEEVEKAFSYLKDSQKLQKSVNLLADKLSDPKISGSLMKLFLKINEAKRNDKDIDIIELIKDDKALLKQLVDQDWGDLIKIGNQLTKIGGKSYEDLIKSGNKSQDNNDQNDDEDEDDEEEDKTKESSSGRKIFFIVTGVVALISIAFLVYRKYNQNKYNDGTYTENKQLYRPTV